MTTRQQILRSSTPGQVPAAGTRAPGEVWTTFPDLQLGVIDASRNAQKLIAVRYFSTAASYAVGEYVVQAGQLYRSKSAVTAGAFNASQWTLTGGSVLVSGAAPANPTPGDMWFDSTGGQLYVYYNDGDTTQWVVAVNQNIAGGVYLPLGGGTMAGDIANATLASDPTIAKGAATKRYVDAGDAAIMNTLSPVVMGDNRIINGDFRIDQRNGGAAGTANGYTIDRWQYNLTQASKGSWRRGGASAGFGGAFVFTSTSAYAPLAADTFSFYQIIEADMLNDIGFGAAGASPMTLSFWANSSLAGTFGGSIRNDATTRSYPFAFTLAANTWTKIVIPISGDTAGTWTLSGSGAGMIVGFDLGSGATYRGPANAWASANYVGATGAVNVVATNGAIFYLTGVKLEIGSVATPYNRQSLAKSLVDCQRYYAVTTVHALTSISTGGSYNGMTATFPVTMRVFPTLTSTTINAETNFTAFAMDTIYLNSCRCFGTAPATGTSAFDRYIFATAEL